MKRKLKVLLVLVVVLSLIASSIASVYADSRGHGNGEKSDKYEQQQEGIDNEDSSDGTFNDVNVNFWAYKAIEKLAKLGVINGYPDKSFKPDVSVTRSQFAKMLVLALDLKTTDNTRTFVDVKPGSWDYKVVEAAKNYLTGYRTSDGKLYFKGSDNAVREDMAVALVKALDLTLVSNDNKLEQAFSDYDKISESLKDYVYTAYKEGLMIGSSGKFDPQGNLTRAQAATLLERALEKTEKVPVDSNDGDKVVVDPGDGTLSTDATLKSLKFDGTAISNFKPATLTYSVVLPAGTTEVPVVTAAVNDTGDATLVITQAADLPGHARVVVTAEDGVTHKTYTVNFTVADAHKSTDATLSSLKVDGDTVTDFEADTTTYNIVLPAGTTEVPTVTAKVHDTGNATAVITQATDLPGHARVVVTAEDGVTHKTYTVNFTVADVHKSTDATLDDLRIDGVKLPGFDADILSYDMILVTGTTDIPTVSAAVHDTGNATLVITQAHALPGHATVVVTAEDGTTHKTYTINFAVAAP